MRGFSSASNERVEEMHRRGIRILPGGDYGFAWAPHGSYSRDLAHFVNMFGFTPMESIIAATAWGGEIMGHPDVLGKVLPGYYADVILVNGDPIKDISILQDTKNLHAIVINGHIHKNSELGAHISRPAAHLPVRVVPKGESVIPDRRKPAKTEQNGHVNGNGYSPDDKVNKKVPSAGKKQVGFFEYGVAEDDIASLKNGQNGELTGVSAELVKGL